MGSLTLYDDGSKYGDADAFYGRLSSELGIAQLSRVRETGLKVSIINEQVNKWEQVVGTDTLIGYSYSIDFPAYDRRYLFYRSQAKAVKLDNGNIVRIRLGNHGPANIADRQIWIQTITDPTSVSQWESWAVLYSGDHYAIEIVQTGATTYDVWHTKDGGLYVNNTLKWATADDGQPLSEAVSLRKVIGQYDYVHSDTTELNKILYMGVVKQDPNDALRYIDIYATYDINNFQPNREDDFNLHWNRNAVIPIQVVDDPERFMFLHTFGYLQNPRFHGGDSFTMRQSEGWYTSHFGQPPILVRGLAGQAGHNELNASNLLRCSDGYYYLFYSEYHSDEVYQINAPSAFYCWQRSKDLIHWSEPVDTGFGHLAPFVPVETNVGGTDYVYVVGNGPVIRRPIQTITTDLSNYVPEASWEIPRENQEGSGSVLVANPGGVNDPIIDLADRRIKIEVGARVASGQYEFAQLDDFWIKSITRNDDGEKSQLNVEVSNIWSRLSSPLRDTFNIIGRTSYNDFSAGRINEPFNYFFSGGSGSKTGNFMRVTGGTCLWTGWKGHNPDFTVQFLSYTHPVSVLFRWIDANNYYELRLADANTLTLHRVRGGSATQILNVNITGNVNKMPGQQRLGVYVNNQYIAIYLNFSLITSMVDSSNPLVQPGYVGFKSSGGAYTVSSFAFQDYEFDWRGEDLIKFALAMGDYHDVSVGDADEKQYALVWGPQTDLPTASDGLRQVLEANKLDLVWQNGRIIVGKFNNSQVQRTLQNEVIETDFVTEANRRINLAIVDGNTDTWLEADAVDERARDRQITAYFDLPELLSKDDVRARVREELLRASKGQSPGAKIPLLFDLWRMDAVTLIDNQGRSHDVRIEGISVEINQSTQPRQIATLDTSLL